MCSFIVTGVPSLCTDWVFIVFFGLASYLKVIPILSMKVIPFFCRGQHLPPKSNMVSILIIKHCADELLCL